MEYQVYVIPSICLVNVKGYFGSLYAYSVLGFLYCNTVFLVNNSNSFHLPVWR
jgi:hypothetical protein